MKTIIIPLLFLMLLLLASCDSPRRRKTTRVPINDDLTFATGTSSETQMDRNDKSLTEEDYPKGEISIFESENSNVQNLPADLSHCKFSADGINGFAKYNLHIGNFNLCQSSVKETDVYIQVKTPITNENFCLFPTYSTGSGVNYIGEPRCRTLPDSKRRYLINLIKNRPGFQDFQITGVMGMKDIQIYFPPPFNQKILSPDAYMFCMKRLAQAGDSSYCETFKSTGAYFYEDI